MKKSVFHGKQDIRTETAEMPALSDGDVMIRIHACGVCGTDVHIYHGEPGSADAEPPVVLGHEFAGEVVEIGKDVTKFKIGDKVTVDPNIYCGNCRFCQNGKKQLCENLTAIGVNRDGGFAEYCVVPESQAYYLFPDVDYEVGAMTEPVACCLHGIENIEIREGDVVVVIGGGAIGLIMVQLAKLRGAASVILSEPVKMRREIGLEVGADAAVNPMEGDLLDQIEAAAGTRQVDVVIECVGKTIATKQSFEIAGKGAQVLLFSVPAVDATFPLPLYDVFKKELKISGSFVNPDTHFRAASLINHGKLNIKPLITHRYDLEQVDEAIQKQMANDSIKVLVLM